MPTCTRLGMSVLLLQIIVSAANLPAISLRGSDLVAGETTTILSSVSPALKLDLTDPRGAFFHAEADSATSVFEVAIGGLKCQRFVACSRQKLWWMYPNWGSKSRDVKVDALRAHMLHANHALPMGIVRSEYNLLSPLSIAPRLPTKLCVRIHSVPPTPTIEA